MVSTPQGVPYDDLPHFVNEDGLYIFTRCWMPPDEVEPRALCLILHGGAEHSGPYDKLAIPLAGSGVAVYAHDHVGHGQSQGDRVDIKDFSIFIRDTLQHVDIIREKYPTLPIFLFGHSMGGTIAVLSAMERPRQFDGVVLSGPALVVSEKLMSSVGIYVLKFVAYWFPTYEAVKVNPQDVSRDPTEVESYATDPLVWHGWLKARLVLQILTAMQKIQTNASSIQWPFLALHGDADRLTDIEGSRMLVEKAKSVDRHLEVYPGHYHALIHEPEQDAAVVIRDIVSWIVRRIPEHPSEPDDVHCRE